MHSQLSNYNEWKKIFKLFKSTNWITSKKRIVLPKNRFSLIEFCPTRYEMSLNLQWTTMINEFIIKIGT